MFASNIVFAESADNMIIVHKGEFRMGCSENDSNCGKDEAISGGVNVFVPAFGRKRLLSLSKKLLLYYDFYTI